MEHLHLTSSAFEDREVLLTIAFKKIDALALEEAAKSKRRVSEVRDLQHEKIEDLFAAKGTDGAALMGEDVSIADDLKKRADETHDQRMNNIAAAPDAYVLPDEGTVVGLQHDDTREIGIAARGLEDDRVAIHEAEHRTQETGDQSVELPPTGDAKVDNIRILSRRSLRENGAVKAEGGLKNHTPEYHGYVASSEAIADYLNGRGMDGEALVDEAGKTNVGFDELHQSIVIASIKDRLKADVPEAEQVLAA